MKGLTKQLWFVIILRSKTYCSTCVLLQAAPVPMYVYMYIVMSCITVRTELKGLTKKSSREENLFPHHNCKFISSCTIMYVCSYDLHYNVLCGRYASELNGLTKKLLFSILPRKKDFHAQLRLLLPCFITISCIVMYVHYIVAL